MNYILNRAFIQGEIDKIKARKLNIKDRAVLTVLDCKLDQLRSILAIARDVTIDDLTRKEADHGN